MWRRLSLVCRPPARLPGVRHPAKGERQTAKSPSAEHDAPFAPEFHEQEFHEQGHPGIRRRRRGQGPPRRRYRQRRPRAHRRGARTARPAAARGTRFRRRGSVRLAPRRPQARSGCPHQPCRHVAPAGHRPRARSPGRKHRAFRQRPAGEQCAPMGRARHGEIVPGQGRPCRDRRRAPGRGAQAHRDPPRGHRVAPRSDGAVARSGATLHRVLRRPVVRRRRHLLQVAQDHARRRHRRPPGQRHLLRHLEPPPSVGARHGRERTLDRDQSRRGRRGKGVAVGPVRTVARLSPLQPGRISGHGHRLCGPLPHPDRGRRPAARGVGMGDDARCPLRPCRLPVCAGSGGTLGRAARRANPSVTPRGDIAPDRPGSRPCGSRNGAAVR